MKKQQTFLYIAAFMSGLINLALEMMVSRLLAPFYGVSNIVWAGVISTVLFYISLGSLLGGKLIDKYPGRIGAFGLVPLLAAVISSLLVIPGYILIRSLFSGGTLGSAAYFLLFIFGLVIFSLPILILSTLLPVITTYLSQGKENSGTIIGRVYALNTGGSILGSITAVLAILPLLGIVRGIVAVNIFLILLGVMYFLVIGTDNIKKIMFLTSISIFIFVCSTIGSLYLKDRIDFPHLVETVESGYNHIQIFNYPEYLAITVNDPYFLQSVKFNGLNRGVDVWNGYCLAPLFRKGARSGDALFLGFGCGTTAELYRQHFPGYRLTGIELDPAMVAVGRKYISSNNSGTRIFIGDARSKLYRLNKTFDVIVSDVFRFPYIPHHLTTINYFSLVKARLKEGGICVVNSGRNRDNDSLVRNIAYTMNHLFKHVYLLNIGSYNTLIFASDNEIVPPFSGVPIDLSETAAHGRENLTAFRSDSRCKVLDDDIYLSEHLTHIMGFQFLAEQ